MAFSFVSALGTPAGPTIDAVLGTGVMFGAFNALFFKIGRAFGAGSQPAVKEEDFARTQHMLRSLGLERFEKNFKKGQLDDKCLLLLTDNVLAEIKIPPGPRLLILNATASYKTQMYNQHRGRADGAPPPGVLPPGMGMVQPSGKQGALQ